MMTSSASSPHIDTRTSHVTAGAGHLERSISCHAAFAFLIPVLLAIIQLHFHDSSPFYTHPLNMWIFLLSTVIYSFAFEYCIKSQIYSPTGTIHLNRYEVVALITGSLASAALISVLVPQHLEPVIFVLYLLFVIIYAASNQIQDYGKNVVSYVKNISMRKKITENNNDQVTNVAVP